MASRSLFLRWTLIALSLALCHCAKNPPFVPAAWQAVGGPTNSILRTPGEYGLSDAASGYASIRTCWFAYGARTEQSPRRLRILIGEGCGSDTGITSWKRLPWSGSQAVDPSVGRPVALGFDEGNAYVAWISQLSGSRRRIHLAMMDATDPGEVKEYVLEDVPSAVNRIEISGGFGTGAVIRWNSRGSRDFRSGYAFANRDTGKVTVRGYNKNSGRIFETLPVIDKNGNSTRLTWVRKTSGEIVLSQVMNYKSSGALELQFVKRNIDIDSRATVSQVVGGQDRTGRGFIAWQESINAGSDKFDRCRISYFDPRANGFSGTNRLKETGDYGNYCDWLEAGISENGRILIVIRSKEKTLLIHPISGSYKDIHYRGWDLGVGGAPLLDISPEGNALVSLRKRDATGEFLSLSQLPAPVDVQLDFQFQRFEQRIKENNR